MLSINRRHILLIVLLLGVATAAYIVVRPADKLAELRAATPKLPTPPGTDRYDAKLRHVFKEAYAPDVILRCLSTGGMLEMVIFVKGNEACLLQTQPGASVWNHEYREMILDGKISGTDATGKPLSTWSMVQKYDKVPISLDDYPVRRRSAPIPDELLAEIKAVWLDALEHATRNKSPRMGLDGGTNTYFLHTDDGRELAGSIWSPDDGPAAALNNVSFALNVAMGRNADTGLLREAIQLYWKEVRKRTSASQELDYNESPLARHPSR